MDTKQAIVGSQPSTQDFAKSARKDNHSLQAPKLTVTPPTPGTTHTSFAERRARMARPSPLTLVNGDRNMRDIDRPPPGDVGVQTKRAQPKQHDVSRQKSAYFQHVFTTKDVNPAKTRVQSEAIVMADIKTNVIIDDEFTFITELSCYLSERYSKPISSIVVTLNHGTCMLFGGNFDPAYVMSVFALPFELQPTTNKRNAALIQKYMEDDIGVPPSRGFLRFITTPEEHTAWKGKTLAGEIDDLEKEAPVGEETGAVRSDGRRTKSKRLSVRQAFTTSKSAPGRGVAQEPTPPASGRNSNTSAVASLPDKYGGPMSMPAKTPKRSKSFMALVFGGRQ